MPGENANVEEGKNIRTCRHTTVFISGKDFYMSYILWYHENYLKLYIYLYIYFWNDKAFICAA